MGMIHLYHGDGKGKTTAALGLALRAAGAGIPVTFLQFLKGGKTSELSSLKKIPEITVIRCDQAYGFSNRLSEQSKQEIRRCHDRNLSAVIQDISQNPCRLLVLDEICAAYRLGLVDPDMVDSLVLDKPEPLELVLTGRDPAPSWMERADYISEIVKVKHPYDQGIRARKGIEV